MRGNLKHIKNNFNAISKDFVKSKKLIFLAVFMLYGYQSFAQVTTVIDTTKLRIGEQIEYQIIVDQIKDVKFTPLKLDSLKRIEVVKNYPIDSLKDRIIKKYALTSFDSGQYILPRQLVFIKDKKVFTDSILIDVATVAVDTIKQPMYPIKDINEEPYTFDDFKKYIWWLLALAALVMLVWYFLYRHKNKDQKVVEEIPPFELAKQRLAELDHKELWQHNKVKQYYVELTDIVRSFIEREMNIPALESTTEELLEMMTDFNDSSQLNIPEEVITKLKGLLKEGDLVKFAKSKPVSHTIENHREEAEEIIDKLHPVIEDKTKAVEDGQ